MNTKTVSFGGEQRQRIAIEETTGDKGAADIVSQYRDVFPGWTPSDVFFDVTSMYLAGRYEFGFHLGSDGGKWHSPHTLATFR